MCVTHATTVVLEAMHHTISEAALKKGPSPTKGPNGPEGSHLMVVSSTDLMV
jgi:hypothetical protein